ncbi:hypothetical protein Q5P01_010333 [Channa striata]|uniref:Uncharacterized protein n=1 Tax=Channa striata TaxID=64152 RepID=A0AA88MXN5_CHASR|nr:hypothetical protein Q5P01_010333 [Channa striata]
MKSELDWGFRMSQQQEEEEDEAMGWGGAMAEWWDEQQSSNEEARAGWLAGDQGRQKSRLMSPLEKHISENEALSLALCIVLLEDGCGDVWVAVKAEGRGGKDSEQTALLSTRSTMDCESQARREREEQEKERYAEKRRWIQLTDSGHCSENAVFPLAGHHERTVQHIDSLKG